jgi:hypothetical protein
MKFNDKQIKMIMDFGALNYPIKKCAVILDILEEDLIKDEEFNKLLLKGKYYSEFKIQSKLLELAMSGDLKAMDKINAIKNPLNKHNLKK